MLAPLNTILNPGRFHDPRFWAIVAKGCCLEELIGEIGVG